MGSPMYSPDFEIHAFEANPLFNNGVFADYPKEANIHRVAASTYNGEIDVYINKDKRINIQGTSIYKDKITGNLDKDHPIKVPCIDFPLWIIDNFKSTDNIIVKSNIEGAEYPLFDKMVDDGTIHYINKLYLRRHWHKIGMTKEMDDKFMKKLQSIETLTIKGDYNFS